MSSSAGSKCTAGGHQGFEFLAMGSADQAIDLIVDQQLRLLSSAHGCVFCRMRLSCGNGHCNEQTLQAGSRCVITWGDALWVPRNASKACLCTWVYFVSRFTHWLHAHATNSDNTRKVVKTNSSTTTVIYDHSVQSQIESGDQCSECRVVDSGARAAAAEGEAGASFEQSGCGLACDVLHRQLI